MVFIMRLLSLTLMLAAFSAVAFARVDPTAAPQHYNYRDASKQMRRVYYGELQETLYCGCKYVAVATSSRAKTRTARASSEQNASSGNTW